MNATLTPISRRDRAVLAAVAAGRAVVEAGALLIDGRYSADQFALVRLAHAGLLDSDPVGPPHLTPAGDTALQAA